ncbi:PaaX family transcriptional regulator C-terminal domain-containing protein [Rhodococcus qingshengii]|jgi:phenylacetic acid degradation operon negative regulatory protein|uniref:PaaX family transcriptional regulator n=1 Tax=Rhodococcus TaxID=1827 RepID=UPI00069501B7|nr:MULTISPECIES: PaaX family transcriptional regulator C-terminal domain-containing protein [Rhodococcus]MCE4268397.1 hypothetical protein [Rhodococcus globerulus]MDJ0491257.1 PaaX family transcriptional regulator C-terminal domain-containing protein [Rhodococcus qingshengii]
MSSAVADGPDRDSEGSATYLFSRRSARSLLVTVLGELVLPSGQPVWTSTLVHILRGLGIEEKAARQAIARASSSGWIHAERQGREVRWTLSDKMVKIFHTGSARVHSLSDPFSSWNGSWLTLVTTIPHDRRSVRRPFYSGLTWAGFGNPTPGLWLSPHIERAPEVRSLVDELELGEHTYSFVGTVDLIGVRPEDIVSRGWDLDALEKYYARVLDVVASLRPASREETLFTHVQMINEWQQMPRIDPQLPEGLLPDWIGRTVARRIESLRAQWATQVRVRYAEINLGAGTE